MHVLAFTVLVVLFPAVFCVDCSIRPDGVYGRGCRGFIHCLNHVANVITCQHKQVFNSNTGRCDDPINVPPPCGIIKDCTTKSDGSYADLSVHCRSYYTCNAGTFFGHNFCTPGTVFNEELQTCDWPSDVKQPCGTKP
ncbi:chitin-binding domain protein cbd-1-like [Gigantopelta aegis]|uniref:chitin-binding domain protein cbd-1-like n=1 Tax=Gigantopelta aegis TaxID=1735272 RepID=UPI001B88C5ED|nr:chitin-binding domain protein cbd-1-like [Gigantopelta aegis]